MSEKIKLGCDYTRFDVIEKILSDFSEKANNTILPLMQELGVKITLEGVVKYAGCSDALEADYIEAEKVRSEVQNAYLLGLIEQNARDKFEAAFDKFPYDDFKTQYSDLLVLSREGVCVNAKAVKEFCTIYLKEDQREAYNRYLKAIDALNDFYRGKAQNGVFIGSQFPVKDGKVFPSQLINFDNYK